ncbi:MAG TPA: phosphoribosylaminoimidazolesuccinocarboxamide synthase, partial [Myxococcaceae bacterium]|nr:phosphoribosylaminoimidazolesuccinocarboxamide synthase [Myxococcaceae bacterium]
MTVSPSPLVEQLPHCLTETDFQPLGLGDRYRGKVRDTYRRGDQLIIVTTDRLSAFD